MLSSACWVIFHDFCHMLIILKINVFLKKILSGIPLECQTVCNEIRPDIVWPDLGPNCLQRLSVINNKQAENWSSTVCYTHV